MAYQYRRLGAVLGWKFNDEPGLTTADGWLTGWPDTLGPSPTDAQLAQWVTEYETYLASAQCKDDELMRFLATNGGKAVKAVALIGVDKGLWTLADLKAKYRSL